MGDPLSDALAVMEARCVITGGLRAGGQWAVRFTPDVPVKLDAIARGSCWLAAAGQSPVRLHAGDAAVLNGATQVVLSSDPSIRPIDAADLVVRSDDGYAHLGGGGEVEVVGGHVAVDAAAGALLASALPEVLIARSSTSEAPGLARLLDQIAQERDGGRPGASFAADQYAQLLLLEAFRLGVQGDLLNRPGWLRLLTDPSLQRAVALMHEAPHRPWKLAELASAVSMSRSTFAHRFRELSGQPPLTYLSHWRIRLAEQALRSSDAAVAELADRLGYASESSFSHAFARINGASPTRYRREVRRRSAGSRGG